MSDKADVLQPQVQIRRTLDGYTWTITVNAEASTLDAMLAATDLAAKVDDDLRERFKYQVAPTQKRG